MAKEFRVVAIPNDTVTNVNQNSIDTYILLNNLIK
jgi:hypothetical protein